ncbi:basic leucine zipper 61-like [Gastrolobium bilobum]|uniref:basic leucine zipper 61-like n=1 Tax=Gastrolobium bilobum TaxID=150636 RepID=UPI002AB2723D|nr:basic leucine zipper 61-like [Gastrolobium bilobum]
MAQLPPKIPNMTPNWPEFSSHQKIPSLTSMSPNGVTNTNISNNHHHHHRHHQNPSWVDEFLDFSSARRGSHRRSASDSITFMEAPMLKGGVDRCEFDRFDDEQFMSMFSDEVSGKAMMPPSLSSSSNPSSPSDHNSGINDEKEMNREKEEDEKQEEQQLKNEAYLDQSQCKQEITEALNDDDDDDDNSNNNANTTTCSNDKITDPKRVKRILANRQSAQRSRVRKLQYISELERSVTSLQAEVSILSPRVAFLDHHRLLLNVDNSALKQRIAALAQDKIFKDAHQEALKREIERLRQVYHQQNIKKMDSAVGSPSPSPKARCDTHSEKEHLINV